MVDNVGIERVEQEDIEELKVEDSVQTPKQDVQYKIEDSLNVIYYNRFW